MTTACSWDEIIPFDLMWAAVKRILKPRGVFVTTASQPFTSLLTVSNLEWFRCEWIWVKPRGSNFANAKYHPLKEHENVLVFSKSRSNYYPQMKQRSLSGSDRAKYKHNASNNGKRDYLSNLIAIDAQYNPNERYPSSVLYYSNEVGIHPTQKPVPLYEYLIRTYTQPGELVLDFCCGSGTTGVACVKTGRNYIIVDSSPEYVKIARDRVNAGFVTVDVAEGISQPSLFAAAAL